MQINLVREQIIYPLFNQLPFCLHSAWTNGMFFRCLRIQNVLANQILDGFIEFYRVVFTVYVKSHECQFKRNKKKIFT